MTFPIDEKYIKETESELNVEFPTEFKNRLIKLNGGELILLGECNEKNYSYATFDDNQLRLKKF